MCLCSVCVCFASFCFAYFFWWRARVGADVLTSYGLLLEVKYMVSGQLRQCLLFCQQNISRYLKCDYIEITNWHYSALVLHPHVSLRILENILEDGKCSCNTSHCLLLLSFYEAGLELTTLTGVNSCMWSQDPKK